MTYEQITQLLDRGFTPDQIVTLTASGVPTAPVNGSAPTGDDSTHPLESSPVEPISEPTTPAPAPAPAPTPEPAPAEDTNPVLDAIAELKADIKKTVQAQNIRTMSVEGVGGENALEMAMAEIIRPSLKKGE